MSDRLGELIADVQSNITPRDALPEAAADKWPGIAVLESDAVVELVDGDHELAGISDGTQRLSLADESESSGLRGDIQHVGFPESINGQVLFDDTDGLAGIESLDALAFYLPFHFYKKWGIYILESGILGLAVDLEYIARQNGCTTVTPSLALDYAYRILWSHEFFHHQTEVACARLQHARPPQEWLYSDYFVDQQAGRDEEAQANAYALKNAKRTQLSDADRALRRAARTWMRQLGAGYCDFHVCEGRGHAPAKDRQVDCMAEQGSCRNAKVLLPGRLLFRDIPATAVPTFLVHDAGGVVSLVRQFPSYGPLKVWAYTNDHKPQHVHVGDGPGNGKSNRFEWPSRTNMDGATSKVVRQFEDYADRFSSEITKKVSRIVWK